MGDEADHHTLSKYKSDPDGHSPGRELELTIDDLKRLYKIFPKVKVCISNHGSRPFRVAFDAGIPLGLMREYSDFLKAPEGWEWKNHYIIDKVKYLHGDGKSGQAGTLQLVREHGCSVVHGHFHTYGGVQYLQSNDPFFRRFGLNTGCLIDDRMYSFKYGKHIATKPTIGCGVVIDGKEGYFVPMPEKMLKG